MDRRTIATTLLCTGALTGVALAGFGLLERAPRLADDAVARVNSVSISNSQFEQYLTIINENSRTEKDPRYVLGRMIDEELLVQRGVELGMVNLNSTVRNALVQAVTRRFATTSDAAEVSDAALANFYDANLDYFTTTTNFKVEVLEPKGFPLPANPLSLKTLSQYLGPAVADQATTLQVGETSKPITVNGEAYRIKLIAREPGEPPPLAEIRDQVLREYRRQETERAFDEYIAWLRERAEIKTRLPGRNP